MSPPSFRPFRACGRSKRSPSLNCRASIPQAEVHALLLAEIEDVEGIEAIEGAAAFLASLPPDRWAIVTSSPRQLAIRRLEAAGLPTSAVFVTGEDVERRKPAPDCFLLAAKRLGRKSRTVLCSKMFRLAFKRPRPLAPHWWSSRLRTAVRSTRAIRRSRATAN
jgi:beta-phosphoglucomutase-like phosphatase (HAD superfamily)